MIELIDIQKTYSTQAGSIDVLKDINLSVSSGEIFGIIGPSGAGKSTLIRCVNLLERPTSGRVVVDQQDLMQLSKQALRQARRKMGMIFQHFNLLSSRNVFDNVALPLEIAGHDRSSIQKKVNDLLDLTGLSSKKTAYPSQLSGGQKQRVAIARALANQPKILLSDEATSALDPETTHSILQLLNDINHRLGVTILLITHEMHVIKEICHRLAILEKGYIIEQNEVLGFFTNPKSHVAKNFMRTSFAHHMPEHIQRRLLATPQLDTNPLLRISFVGDVAEQPLISSLIQKFSLSLNILLADIEQIRDVTVGVMLLELSGTKEQLKQAIQYLNNLGINAEIIGYVKRTL